MSDPNFPYPVIARIAEYIEPINRGDRYEDPLHAELEQRAIGRVTGGGSQLDEQFRIVYVELEMELANLDGAVETVATTLTKLGCPFGSELMFEKDGKPQSVPIGVLEGLEIYLDGVGLPDDVYSQSDFEKIYMTLNGALKAASAGEARGVWGGPEETAIYTFGPSADGVCKIVEQLHPQIPLFQNARLVFKRKAPSQPQEKRLPMYS